MKQIVNVEEVISNLKFRRKLNKMQFDDIEWQRYGMPCFFTDKEKEEHKLSGLNNIDFISAHFII